MNPYQVHAIEGASPVELVVSLYDGIIRFLSKAIETTEQDDIAGRRAAVKRALDIVIHLQATLRMDVGGKVAETLAEYYAAIFALILQASQTASKERFEHAITCVQNVREAWKQVASDPEALEALRKREESSLGLSNAPVFQQDTEISSRWMA